MIVFSFEFLIFNVIFFIFFLNVFFFIINSTFFLEDFRFKIGHKKNFTKFVNKVCTCRLFNQLQNFFSYLTWDMSNKWDDLEFISQNPIHRKKIYFNFHVHWAKVYKKSIVAVNKIASIKSFITSLQGVLEGVFLRRYIQMKRNLPYKYACNSSANFWFQAFSWVVETELLKLNKK